jgi:hypothetical protein
MTETQAVAKYFSPGAMFAEEDTVELPDRSVDAAVTRVPDHAFAFVLYDRPIIDFDYDAGRFTVIPKLLNPSGKHYIGGQVFTCDELRALAEQEGDPDKYRVLIANVSHYEGGTNVEGRAIRCRTGNWQPFEEGDVVVDVDG